MLEWYAGGQSRQPAMQKLGSYLLDDARVIDNLSLLQRE